ncbi:hypothetical protein SAMN05444007_1199 [Cribrihabitans marinus]|uniref:Uncharacterized protein n=1 Tax=Cribrihabitans marinus TaxID=1227549 RepID=A0A1H7E093_9RHOB|nr:hypothetical protein [Cribrihabitans marinus]GGH41436.1 hypothetical protein GCM10010973_38380 [Cribrihabitans marinus]SEK07429.1 hypothetical protein SAMN05444007_1199 [Cribrihabitans marinus]
MLNTSNLDAAEARLGAAYAAEKHLHRHGGSLCDLLDALDDPSGFAALCNMHGVFGQPIPDVDAVEAALRDIHRVLADQRPSSLDRTGHERGLPVSDMMQWHGARVSELLARFRHAE